MKVSQVLIFNMVTKVFIIILLMINFAYSECNYLTSKIDKSNIKLIKIDINNSQSYFKKAARFYLAVNSDTKSQRYKNNPKYKKQYQKKTKAKISFVTKNGFECTYKAKIRGHGDGDDHLNLINGNVLSSYRIKLDEGNINNITRFILFRPQSRNFDNEIFVSSLLRELGFLSPRTFKVKVEINNVVTDYIFQENLKKEFLEYNKKLEGPILEAKEDTNNFNMFTLARVSNVEWIKGIGQNYIISLNAIKNINFHRSYGYSFRMKSINYLKDSGKIVESNYDGLAIDEILRFKKENLTPDEYKKIGTYQALMYALDASHGLSYDDTRFYYDPIYNTIEPVYYDGNSNILSIINFDRYTGEYANKIANWQKVKNNILDFDEYLNYPSRHNLLNQVVTELAKNNAKDSIKMIDNLNLPKFYLELKNSGMNEISLNQLETVIEFIKNRLIKISTSKVKENLTSDEKLFEKYSKEMSVDKNLELNFYNNLHEKNKKIYLSLEKCDLKLSICKTLTVEDNKIIDFLEQKNIFFAALKNEYKSGLASKTIKSYEDEYQSKKYFSKINVTKNNSVSINFNKEEKKIYINYLKKDGKVYLSNSNLDSWKIYMSNNTKNNDNENYRTILESKKLTGCLTIIDSVVHDIEIYADNFFCEDTVNFIRTTGTINNIEINNSSSDGLDIDFSNISISKLKIYNAGNDCADFSFGNYSINDANLFNCGDKALSVGEKSIMKINNIKSSNVLTGVASKDDSNTKIQNAYFKNIKTCLAAYKKKQEFNGGRIDIKNFSCENFSNNYSFDELSNIEIN
jgi:hypothetical protein